MPVTSPSSRRQQHWRHNKRLTLALLLLWALVTFGAPFYAHRLNFSVLGWPFGFWAAAQGALLVYGLIVVCYAWSMNRADRHHLGGPARQD
jgi:putative solute:sodium symporter small subunit